MELNGWNKVIVGRQDNGRLVETYANHRFRAYAMEQVQALYGMPKGNPRIAPESFGTCQAETSVADAVLVVHILAQIQGFAVQGKSLIISAVILGNRSYVVQRQGDPIAVAQCTLEFQGLSEMTARTTNVAL